MDPEDDAAVAGLLNNGVQVTLVGSMVSIIDRHAGGPYGAHPAPRWPQQAHYAASGLKLF
jgi:hypothetical protein